nr:hypothetical protein [uncultured bacterium]
MVKYGYPHTHNSIRRPIAESHIRRIASTASVHTLCENQY